MKKLKMYKVDTGIFISIIIFSMISIISIFSSQKLLSSFYQGLALKQLIWYILGFLIIIIIMKIKNDRIYKNIWLLYLAGIISLMLLLLFAKPINDAKCWFTIPGIGAIQPSEFMKIILIIALTSLIHNFHDKYPTPTIKEEFMFLFKTGIIVLIPSILTFLQPDTGVVLIYILITITMLFMSGIRFRWFVILFSIAAIIIALTLGLYFINSSLFIKLFGNSFFLRINRLLDWSNRTGYQLENGMAAIGAGGIIGYGFGNTPIYFPEPQTDFIFAIFANNTGFLGSLFIILLILYFDIKLILLSMKASNEMDKYMLIGIIGMLLYQQFQNIGMTLGIMPITGITLPFISYGGSSLLSYMIMVGIIFNISNKNLIKQK